MDRRTTVVRILGTPGADTRFGPSYLPQMIRESTGCLPHEAMEILWGLVADGLIYLDPAAQGSATDNWRWRLSTLGTQVVAGGPWEPRDPEGYLARLRRRIPDLDSVAYRYVEEALRAFNSRCHLATSVMLGVAAEQVFLQLAQSMVDALGTSADGLRKTLENPKASQYTRFVEMRKRLEPLRPSLPDGLGDTLTLDAVADLLRVTRNDAGHPTGRAVDEDTAHTHLQMGARYLEKMTALRKHFEAQVDTAQP